MQIKPKYGVNLRQKSNSFINYWAGMQNVDMFSDDDYRQILGSVRYHGDSLGDNAPTAIIPIYNNEQNKYSVLACVDDKVVKKNLGGNEFSTLKSGLTPNLIEFGVEIEDKGYFAHPEDGLFEYDGVSVFEKVDDIKLRDIILSKETNRAFGITKDNELVWTDSLETIGGVPIQWSALNVTTIHPTRGDVPEKLWFLEGRLIVLMTNSIWIYYVNGSPSNWRPEKAPTVVGVIAPKTVRQVGTELWFLGFSPDTGIGVYAFNGRTSRLISYNIEPYLKRANPERVRKACSEYVENIYKLSFAIDTDLENETTFHFDTIKTNEETGSPNIYGPHTYGFNCSALLDTKKAKGEHLFGRKQSGEARIYRVDDYKTQYSTELSDDGVLIPSVLLSPTIETVNQGKSSYDFTWIKKFKQIFIKHPSTGTYGTVVKIYKGFKNEVYKTFDEYLEGNNYSIEALNLENDPVNFEAVSIDAHLENIKSDSIQFAITNTLTNGQLAIEEITFEASPFRRKKYVQKVPS